MPLSEIYHWSWFFHPFPSRMPFNLFLSSSVLLFFPLSPCLFFTPPLLFSSKFTSFTKFSLLLLYLLPAHEMPFSPWLSFLCILQKASFPGRDLWNSSCGARTHLFCWKKSTFFLPQVREVNFVSDAIMVKALKKRNIGAIASGWLTLCCLVSVSQATSLWTHCA